MNRKMQTIGTWGRLFLIAPLLATIFNAKYIAALVILVVMLLWLLHDQVRFVRKAAFWFSIDAVFLALLFGVPLSLGAYNQFWENQGPKSASQLASEERTFDVLCVGWQEASTFERNFGKFAKRGWCKDYVHRLPGGTKQAAETQAASQQLWK